MTIERKEQSSVEALSTHSALSVKDTLKLAIEVLKNSQDYKMGRASTVEAVADIERALAQPERTWVHATTWKGLTDEDISNFVKAVWPREATAEDYIRAIEAKLKQKNRYAEEKNHYD